MKLKYLDPRAKDLDQFVRGSKEAAGYDLCAMLPEKCPFLDIPAGETVIVGTGVALWIDDPNIVGMVYPRSGTATKRGLVLANGTGVVDSDYQGEWKLAIRNALSFTQTIEHGERLAQVVFTPVLHPEIEEVDDFETETARGEGGFGSTGTK